MIFIFPEQFIFILIIENLRLKKKKKLRTINFNIIFNQNFANWAIS